MTRNDPPKICWVYDLFLQTGYGASIVEYYMYFNAYVICLVDLSKQEHTNSVEIIDTVLETVPTNQASARPSQLPRTLNKSTQNAPGVFTLARHWQNLKFLKMGYTTLL